METIWKSVNELGGRRWIITSLLPALLSIIVAGWLYVDVRIGYPSFWQWWHSLSTSLQFANFAIGLGLVIALAFVLDALGLSLLRWAEGYWSLIGPLGWLYDRRHAHHRKVRQAAREAFNELKNLQDKGELNAVQERKLQNIEDQLHYYPATPKKVMPTWLGNIMRSAEEYARVRYGLDPIVTWFRLYPFLSEELRDSLDSSRTTLDFSLRLITLVAFVILIAVPLEGFLISWTRGLLMLTVGATALWLFYLWSIQAAKVYSDLMRTAFDLHRFDLYEALRLGNRPSENLDVERQAGQVLTQLLWRGDVPIQYDHHRGTKGENASTK